MPSKAKNIVVIITDQQRMDSLACNGNVFVKSPNIDKLSNNGINFDCAMTPFPVCTPARGTMWTGVLPHAHGLIFNRYDVEDVYSYESKEKRTVFEPLKDAGFTTAYFGKWHLGEGNSGRFDVWSGFNSRGGHWEQGKQQFQGGKYKPETQTEEMIEFFKSDLAKEKPFIAIQSYYPPHQPFSAPSEFFEFYRGKGIPFPGYYAAVSALDSYVGQITASLEAEGMAENTLVVFMSDHGETFDQNPLNPHKFVCLDQSIRIPFILSGAGISAKGRRISAPIGLEDLAPTLLDAAGASVPDHMHGRSLFELINGASDWRDCYYIQSVKNKVYTIQRALRTDRWKLILSGDECHELYDLVDDPEEVLNIFGAPREDIHDRYLNYGDTTATILKLSKKLHAEAVRFSDHAGIDLSARVVRQEGLVLNQR